jgi:ferredoxin-thioredoxin reductase catalytic subunit
MGIKPSVLLTKTSQRTTFIIPVIPYHWAEIRETENCICEMYCSIALVQMRNESQRKKTEFIVN